ncbi:MAG: AtpZ/AtpI family protein [Acidisphaera sp.]|nr:AtpZ/AtpI family protein [Acidisphaera sp.]MBV9813795.1 AtpZ/AtpI family protein [Acetobacteraceae bacterium]
MSADPGDQPPQRDSFEARLRNARERAGLDAPPSPPPSSSGTPSALGVGMRVGVELVSALVVAVGIGWLLDRWLHTTPVFIVIFLFLGGAAGVSNVYRLMGPKRDRRMPSDEAG